MATKANPSAYNCYDKAEPDEPLFVLLARDKYAATLIWIWSKLREEDGDDSAQWREALLNVSEVLGWRSLKGKERPALQEQLERIRRLIDGIDLEAEYQRAKAGVS